MKVNKILSINTITNKLAYETENEIITNWNEIVFFAEIKRNNLLILVGNDNRFEVNDADSFIKKTLIDSGFLQVNNKILINTNFIHRIIIHEQKVELYNNILIPYTIDYKTNIENFINSISYYK